MKGLILTAGRGTRLRPLSYTKPKPLLPVANQAVIQYGILQLYNIGIREIGLVIPPGQQETFEDHLNLENDLTVRYIVQNEPKGIAHAVSQAEDFIGSESFVLLLGDNLIDEPFQHLKESFDKENIDGSIMLTKVKNPEDYGIAEVKKKKIINLVEKPEKPKSKLAVIGVYIFTPLIFKAIHSITPSSRGEYEITDAIQWMINQGYAINYVKAHKPAFDVGTMDRWLEANEWMLQKKEDINHHDLVENTVIIPPVVIGENCKIKDSVIGPFVSIEPNTTIKKCRINNSIILKDSCLKNIPYEISKSIFGERTKIVGKNSKQHTINGILGDDSSLILSNSPAPQDDTDQ
ncbi:glucose-1-phosphate thymidylyltransferase [Halobacillus sp. Marseille-Q1614]|uniref:glucose-1-phosphate thymidylyltransferase n=1 Tax=Halobacillus sp. Marseille-Q1614 TaxID=2709134 RepID=UPI0015713015|nr:glucose-1-phosphate thymidylyltransferase [Halobacillus sp. Marseille-Q1614]